MVLQKESYLRVGLFGRYLGVSFGTNPSSVDFTPNEVDGFGYHLNFFVSSLHEDPRSWSVYGMVDWNL